MGYTNETTHYGIPLPLGSDLTTPMDYNESLTKVDRDLYANTQGVTQATGKVNDLEVALGTTNDNVTAVTGRVTTLEGTVTTQGNAITQNASRIEEVEDDALDMICAVDEGTAQVATVAVQKGKYFRYNNVLYMATANIAIGDTIVPNTNCRATNVAVELETIAPSGETVDETARTEIGNLSNLQTTSKANLVAAINEVLSQIGGGLMPEFDTTKIVHTFSASDSYTCTDDVYIYVARISTDGVGTNASISANNIVIAEQTASANGQTAEGATGFLGKFARGTVFTTSANFGPSLAYALSM